MLARVTGRPVRERVAGQYVAEAGLRDRVDYIEGDALKTAWPMDQDVVLFSYLLSAVGKADIEALMHGQAS